MPSPSPLPNVNTAAPVAVAGQPRVWLRLEAAAVLAVAVTAHAAAGRSWPLFAAVFLLPDLSILAYLGGPRVGAAGYNAMRTYVLPVALGAAFHCAGWSMSVPLIWIAHIGFDRTLGYGLKDDAGFAFAHLGRLGREAALARET